LPSPTLPINACVTLYALPILTSALSVYVIFAICINKNQNGTVITREDRMLMRLASREWLRFKEVISWISKQSVWTNTNCVHCVGNLRFQC